VYYVWKVNNIVFKFKFLYNYVIKYIIILYIFMFYYQNHYYYNNCYEIINSVFYWLLLIRIDIIDYII